MNRAGVNRARVKRVTGPPLRVHALFDDLDNQCHAIEHHVDDDRRRQTAGLAIEIAETQREYKQRDRRRTLSEVPRGENQT